MSLSQKNTAEWTDFKQIQHESSASYNEVPAENYPKQKWRLLEALDIIEKLDDDWNAYGAIKPSAQSITMTRHFINRMVLNKEFAHEIEPDGDAAIILKWKSKDRNIALTIDGLYLHLMFQESDKQPIFIHDVQFFDIENKILPAKILKYIPARSNG